MYIFNGINKKTNFFVFFVNSGNPVSKAGSCVRIPREAHNEIHIAPRPPQPPDNDRLSTSI